MLYRDVKRGQMLEAEAEHNVIFHSGNMCCKNTG